MSQRKATRPQPSLSLDDAKGMLDGLIAQYADPGFQTSLTLLNKVYGADDDGPEPLELVRRRRELTLPVQGPVIARYGFEPTQVQHRIGIIEYLFRSLPKALAREARQQEQALAKGRQVRALPDVVGSWAIGDEIGKGGGGGSVFYAYRDDGMGEASALKYDANAREVAALRVLGSSTRPCLGVPLVYELGEYKDKCYIVMELLQDTLRSFVADCGKLPVEARWQGSRVLGCLLLRRLHAMHSAGFVHCDLKPENIMLGCQRCEQGRNTQHVLPFLIDFGQARPFPGGGPVRAGTTALEFESVRAGDGLERAPRDDAESLGWLLCHCVFDEMPWFSWVRETTWEDKEQRLAVVRRVQEAKRELLAGGWGKYGERFSHVPPELAEYLRRCHDLQAEGPIDYAALLEVLAGSPASGPMLELEADSEDLAELADFLERARSAKRAG